jgi:hypothetical protein
MKHLLVRALAPALLPFCLGGCAMLGAGGSMLGGLFSFALYMAAIAAPILLSYYLYKRQHN